MEKIPIFNAIPKGAGVTGVALVEAPAHESNFEAFDAAKYRFADAKKQVITGALMIPDRLIFRKDGEGKPYYLKFSAEAVEMAALLFHKNKFTDITNEGHTDSTLTGVYMFESVLVASAEQVNHYKNIGLGELPMGTWVGSYKVENKDTFGKIQSGELKGFSVEMFLDLQPAEFWKVDETTTVKRTSEYNADGSDSQKRQTETERIITEDDGSVQRVVEKTIYEQATTMETRAEFYAAMGEIDILYQEPVRPPVRHCNFMYDTIEECFSK